MHPYRYPIQYAGSDKSGWYVVGTVILLVIINAIVAAIASANTEKEEDKTQNGVTAFFAMFGIELLIGFLFVVFGNMSPWNIMLFGGQIFELIGGLIGGLFEVFLK